MNDNTENNAAYDGADQAEPTSYPRTPAQALNDGDMINASVMTMTAAMERAHFKGRAGWQNRPVEHLKQGYLEAVQKGGEPADVMNYAGMLYCRGESLPGASGGSPQQQTCEQIVLWAMDQAGIEPNDPEAVRKIQSIITEGVAAKNYGE